VDFKNGALNEGYRGKSCLFGGAIKLLFRAFNGSVKIVLEFIYYTKKEEVD